MFIIVVKEENERYYVLNVSDITMITNDLLERNCIKKEAIAHIYRVNRNEDKYDEFIRHNNELIQNKASFNTMKNDYNNYFKPFYKQNGLWVDDFGKIGKDKEGELWVFVGFRDEAKLSSSTKFKVCCTRHLQTQKIEWRQKKEIERMFDIQTYSFKRFKRNPHSKDFDDDAFNKAYLNQKGEVRRFIGFQPYGENRSEYVCKVVSASGKKRFKATIEYVKSMLSERPYEPNTLYDDET